MSWELTPEEVAVVEPIVEQAQVDLVREFGSRAAHYRIRGILLRACIMTLRGTDPDHKTPVAPVDDDPRQR